MHTPGRGRGGVTLSAQVRFGFKTDIVTCDMYVDKLRPVFQAIEAIMLYTAACVLWLFNCCYFMFITVKC